MPSEEDAAWLVYRLHKADRYGRDAWIGRQPIGVKVLHEVLTTAGRQIGTCSPRAPHPRVVLVSFTSEHDVLAFYRQVSLLPAWQPGARTFRVIAGGYGMQNPQPARNYIDYACFGRAEREIEALVECASERRPSDDEAVMNLRDDIHPVRVRQATTLYDGLIYREKFTGCPLKCKFCHYTFARAHTGADHAYSRTTGTAGAYVQTTGHDGRGGSSSMEVTWPQLIHWPHPRRCSDLTVGLDGPSERLRWLYGKRISDAEIAGGLNAYFEGAEDAGLAGVKMKVYDIAGFPGEIETDREALAHALEQVRPGPMRRIVMLHATPFKASAWTPMQWEAFAMDDWASRLAGRTIASWGEEVETHVSGRTYPRSQAIYSRFIEGPGSQIEYAAVQRCDGSIADRTAFHAVVHAPGLRSGRSRDRLRRFRRAFPEQARRWFGEHEIGAPLPTQIATATVGTDRLISIATKMRADRDQSERQPGWRRGKRTIMGALAA